jgi:hypothetical protein
MIRVASRPAPPACMFSFLFHRDPNRGVPGSDGRGPNVGVSPDILKILGGIADRFSRYLSVEPEFTRSIGNTSTPKKGNPLVHQFGY